VARHQGAVQADRPGAAWALIQPLGTMAVFYFFLRDQGGDHNTIPDGFSPLFAFAGLLPWTFFGNAISTASQSVVGNQNLVTKVYFPRMMIPMATVGARMVDFLVGAVLLIVLIVGYNLSGTSVVVGWSVLLLPLVVILLAIAAIGVGAFLSALTVAYRDFRHVIPFLVQFWMFATPSIYQILGPTWKPWMPLNPAYGLILNFRWDVLGQTDDPEHALYALAVSGVVSLLLLAAGCIYFRRVERGFADVI
jgi:lipopolysaccharide transport system permease protein